MSAKAVLWRCHRSLVADALLARGVEVLHIMAGALTPAKLALHARVGDGRATYSGTTGRQATRG